MTKPATLRVIEWNQARYDQVFDYNLACQLLLEETAELFETKSDIGKMDAIGDIVFVAIGVLWKLGLTNDEIYNVLYLADLRGIDLEQSYSISIEVQAYLIDEFDHDIEASWPGLLLALNSIFITAIGALSGMGMQDMFYEILHAICDSNDTKIVEGKTPAHEKANKVKGLGFVPPDEKLFELYTISMKKRKLVNGQK